jgi:DNA (cytosine-5)-methyltransferase 1
VKARLLDLFCGAGGAAKGYQRAGFYVVGVDIKLQPHYCGDEFYQADALEYCAEHGKEFDAIHASPPCQAYSECTPMWARKNHPDLIGKTREVLQKTGKPFIIENVENARSLLENPIMLCGSMFDLEVWRHRYFEIFGIWMLSKSSCRHIGHPVTVRAGSNARKAQGGKHNLEHEKKSMGIDWMTGDELTEAIPPAYTQFIGTHLLEALKVKAR